MKKALLILSVVFITGCGLVGNDCHQCIGGSSNYYNNLRKQLNQKMITYNDYAKAVQNAKNCEEIVCNKDRCNKHK